MKKTSIFGKLLVIIMLFLPFTVSAAEEVKVYFFWGVGCGHCEDAKIFFNEFEKDYSDKYELIEIEVFENKKNANLMSDVSKELNVNIEAVPFFVIGEETVSGFSNASKAKIKNAILDQYERQELIDLIAPIIKDKGYDISSEDDSNSSIIIMFLVLVLLGGFIYIFKDRKK